MALIYQIFIADGLDLRCWKGNGFLFGFKHIILCVSFALRVLSTGINFHKALGNVLLSTHPKWTLTRHSWITYRTIAGASSTSIYVTSTEAYTNIERDKLFHSISHFTGMSIVVSISQHVFCVHLNCHWREVAYHHLHSHSHINAK